MKTTGPLIIIAASALAVAIFGGKPGTPPAPAVVPSPIVAPPIDNSAELAAIREQVTALQADVLKERTLRLVAEDRAKALEEYRAKKLIRENDGPPRPATVAYVTYSRPVFRGPFGGRLRGRLFGGCR